MGLLVAHKHRIHVAAFVADQSRELEHVESVGDIVMSFECVDDLVAADRIS